MITSSPRGPLVEGGGAFIYKRKRMYKYEVSERGGNKMKDARVKESHTTSLPDD